MKISAVPRVAPTKLRDNLLLNSQQIDYNTLRAIIQAYLNTNKNWTAHDFRNDTVESDPMKVDYIGKGKGNNKSKGKDSSKSKGKSKGKWTKTHNQDKDC